MDIVMNGRQRDDLRCPARGRKPPTTEAGGFKNRTQWAVGVAADVRRHDYAGVQNEATVVGSLGHQPRMSACVDAAHNEGRHAMCGFSNAVSLRSPPGEQQPQAPPASIFDGGQLRTPTVVVGNNRPGITAAIPQHAVKSVGMADTPVDEFETETKALETCLAARREMTWA